MKNTKTMTYKEMENELIANRRELRTASLEQKTYATKQTQGN